MSNCRYFKGDTFGIILNRVLDIVLTETDIKDFDYSFHGVRVESACDRARWIGKKKPASSSFPIMLLRLSPSLARSLALGIFLYAHKRFFYGRHNVECTFFWAYACLLLALPSVFSYLAKSFCSMYISALKSMPSQK